jgi:hypothetical protein
LEGLQGVIFKKPVNPVILKKLLLQQCRTEQANPKPSIPRQAMTEPTENPKTN